MEDDGVIKFKRSVIIIIILVCIYYHVSLPCSERWVLHSTKEYAESVIAQAGLKKPSDETLTRVSEELLQEFQRTGLNISQPIFKKAHRWSVLLPVLLISLLTVISQIHLL